MTNHYLFKQSKLILILLFVGLAVNSFAQFPTEITVATQQANAESLSDHFNNKIELVLPEKSGVFSKEQAQLVMGNFFKLHPPTKFSIIHQGNRQHSSFAIGKYISENNIFRFYFLTKLSEDKIYIHQLRIEQEDD